MHTYSMNSFICLLSKRSLDSILQKHNLILIACVISFFFSLIVQISPVSAQDVLFDFNNAPLYSSLPLYQTAGGITAHLSATGQGYSIQNANVLGFTPPGFDGRILYPNSIYASDIMVHFDHTITDFSIMYCAQELACDDACTMRVTAYMSGNYVGYNTRMTQHPGTWPVDTLRCTFSQGFDSVIVHYFLPPPTCQDYGVVYLCDNMRVTPFVTGISKEGKLPVTFTLSQNYPNPFNPTTNITFEISKTDHVSLTIYDMLGKLVVTLVNRELLQGKYSVDWNASLFPSGIYYYRLTTKDFTATKKMSLIK